MEKKPKTKEVVRTVKEHAAGAVKDKATQVGVKTKEAVTGKVEEQLNPQQGKKGEQSPESYASDQVTETSERLADDAVYIGDRAIKGTVRHIKKIWNEKKEAKQEVAAPEQTEPDSPQQTSGENDEPTAQVPDEAQSPEGSDRQTAKPNKSDSSKKKEQPNASSDTPTEPDNADKPKDKTDRKPGKTTQKKQTDLEVASNSPSSDTSTGAKKNIAKKPEQDVKVEERTVKKPVTKDSISVTESEKKTIRRKTPEQAAIKERTKATPKNAFGSDAPERDIKPRTKQKSLPKQRGQQTIKHAGTRANEFRTAASTSHKVKEVRRGTTQTIKTADKTVKNAERTAKATKKAAETTAKAAKRSEEAARRTAKAAIHATKVAIKAAIEGIKAAIAAGKELIAAIGAGGPVVLVIIIVICLIAAIGGTCFGIFLSNDKTTGTEITMSEAISQLTAEHYSNFTNLKASYSYDSMEVDAAAGGMAINWKDVLAVYAVKTTTSSEDAYEVVTMDDVKMDLLRKVISDMNQITCVVEPRQVTETVTETDKNGNTVTTTKTLTKNVLKVTIKRLTVDEIITQYSFSEEQKKQLNELMGPDYDDLWSDIIGANGDVLITNSTHIPTNIFAWPLQENWNITSSYGYRHDPDTGEWKFHGGTDIAAPTGTPILAAAEGTVVISNYMAGGYGYYVKIQHNDTFATLYGHCSVLYVTPGQVVKQGQIIADVGQTGYATGPHVHFEVYVNGIRVDAMQYFK